MSKTYFLSIENIELSSIQTAKLTLNSFVFTSNLETSELTVCAFCSLNGSKHLRTRAKSRMMQGHKIFNILLKGRNNN